MSLSVFKTFSAGEVLSAADLNSSLTQITDNGEDLGWPATKAKDLDSQKLILDTDADTSITADTDDQIDIEIGAVDRVKMTKTLIELTSILLDLNGNELILDADADTSITADTNDQIDIKIGGTDRIKMTKTLIELTSILLDLNGNELILDADANSSFHASTDDQIDVKVAGADVGAFTAAVTNYTSGVGLFVINDGSLESTAYAVTAQSAGTSETVGKTGSGATNIWAALDTVPATAKFVYVQVQMLADSNAAGDTLLNCYAGKAGTTITGDLAELVGHVAYTADAAGEAGQNLDHVFIPVSSAVIFIARWSTINDSGSSVIFLRLKGWVT